MARVEVDLQNPYQMLSSQNIKRGQIAMANQALADMNPFVPKREGTTRMTGYVTSNADAITWNTPYVRRLFYNQFYKYTTPGTGPRWDLKAGGLFMNDWQQAFLKGADF